jgi:hypothetical protein
VPSNSLYTLLHSPKATGDLKNQNLSVCSGKIRCIECLVLQSNPEIAVIPQYSTQHSSCHSSDKSKSLDLSHGEFFSIICLVF